MIKPGDIILGGGTNSLILKAMRWLSPKNDPVNFSHAMIVRDEDTIIHSTFSLFGSSGVCLAPMSWVEKHYPNVLVLRYKNAEEAKTISMLKRGEALFGIKYSFRRLLRHLLDKIFETRWFTKNLQSNKDQLCSSFVAWMYFTTYRVKFNNVEWQSCDPDDIDDHAQNSEDWIVV